MKNLKKKINEFMVVVGYLTISGLFCTTILIFFDYLVKFQA